jgi:ribosome-associated protein
VPASEEAIGLALAAAAAADERKGTSPLILEVADVLVIADVFLVVGASNERQVAAIAAGIEERLHTEGRRVLRREGAPSTGWVLLDFGDLICHVMHDEQREFFALERLWADVPQRDALTGAVLAGARDR